MEHTNDIDDVEDISPAWTHEEQENPYGSVPGLDDSELADPDELERRIERDEFAAILSLSDRHDQTRLSSWQWGARDTDSGAFGTVDFERQCPPKGRHGAQAFAIRMRLKDIGIKMSIIRERLPQRAARLILGYLRQGVIHLDHIVDADMLALARYTLEAQRLRRQLAPTYSRAGAPTREGGPESKALNTGAHSLLRRRKLPEVKTCSQTIAHSNPSPRATAGVPTISSRPACTGST